MGLGIQVGVSDLIEARNVAWLLDNATQTETIGEAAELAFRASQAASFVTGGHAAKSIEDFVAAPLRQAAAVGATTVEFPTQGTVPVADAVAAAKQIAGDLAQLWALADR